MSPLLDAKIPKSEARKKSKTKGVNDDEDENDKELEPQPLALDLEDDAEVDKIEEVEVDLDDDLGASASASGKIKAMKLKMTRKSSAAESFMSMDDDALMLDVADVDVEAITPVSKSIEKNDKMKKDKTPAAKRRKVDEVDDDFVDDFADVKSNASGRGRS